MEIKRGVKIGLIAGGIVALVVAVILITTSVPRESTTANQSSPNTTTLPGTNAVLYEPKYTFYNFTDPKEGAFSMNVPTGWQMSSDSGIIRPYIDAGVKIQATSSKNQEFFYISPYGVYTTPNDLLTMAGFPEGSYYDPSGGFATPMLVKSYTEAGDFLNEYVQQIDANAEILDTADRADLLQEPSALISQQSAAEITYTSNGIKGKIIAYNYLVEISGTGIWMASLFGYSSPEALFNETEYLVLKSSETMAVNPTWAAKEAEEVNKRLGIISSTQASISDTIASTFEYRSKSQDKITHEWSKTILGVEEVYNSETGSTTIVDSGANYYWMDNQNNIYGTETAENPAPLEDLTPLEIKKGI